MAESFNSPYWMTEFGRTGVWQRVVLDQWRSVASESWDLIWFCCSLFIEEERKNPWPSVWLVLDVTGTPNRSFGKWINTRMEKVRGSANNSSIEWHSEFIVISSSASMTKWFGSFGCTIITRVHFQLGGECLAPTKACTNQLTIQIESIQKERGRGRTDNKTL